MDTCCKPSPCGSSLKDLLQAGLIRPWTTSMLRTLWLAQPQVCLPSWSVVVFRFLSSHVRRWMWWSLRYRITIVMPTESGGQNSLRQLPRTSRPQTGIGHLLLTTGLGSLAVFTESWKLAVRLKHPPALSVYPTFNVACSDSVHFLSVTLPPVLTTGLTSEDISVKNLKLTKSKTQH